MHEEIKLKMGFTSLSLKVTLMILVLGLLLFKIKQLMVEIMGFLIKEKLLAIR